MNPIATAFSSIHFLTNNLICNAFKNVLICSSVFARVSYVTLFNCFQCSPPFKMKADVLLIAVVQVAILLVSINVFFLF